MKKLFVFAIAALGGVIAVRRAQQSRAEEDLWHEATHAGSADLR